ncbi:hypothetical protein RDI58_020404 [Solanum bulbocastanum]|uniref:Uncharacterized protein n=1 Tax=Solanum bulbocastanum TaxID=147425 RepID=A0AAN8YAM6_SOLBU
MEAAPSVTSIYSWCDLPRRDLDLLLPANCRCCDGGVAPVGVDAVAPVGIAMTDSENIDAMIQTVLGHYMEDFEGAVSAENLGQKFGVYGSFLLTDQLVIQPQISQKLPFPIPISSH